MSKNMTFMPATSTRRRRAVSSLENPLRAACQPRNWNQKQELSRGQKVLGSLAGTTMVERKLKTALDESRLLILGAQVLFGFQFQSVFQERFTDLSWPGRACLAASLALLLLSIGLLITPSLHHQIRFRG